MERVEQMKLDELSVTEMTTRERSRMNIVLDLDNTLICACTPYEYNKIPKTYQKNFVNYDLDGEFRIFARPDLQDFLDFLFENFNVSVFTAAEYDYALFIINHFLLTKPGRRLNYFFHRYHVEIGEKRYGDPQIKDLRIYWEYFKLPGFFPCNTLIVDDLPDVQQVNPLNTLRVWPFEMIEKGEANVNAIYDDVLMKVKVFLQEMLESPPSCHGMEQKYRPALIEAKNFV